MASGASALLSLPQLLPGPSLAEQVAELRKLL
jgi:hypothetical protein